MEKLCARPRGHRPRPRERRDGPASSRAMQDATSVNSSPGASRSGSRVAPVAAPAAVCAIHAEGRRRRAPHGPTPCVTRDSRSSSVKADPAPPQLHGKVLANIAEVRARAPARSSSQRQ